jgi:predicted phosphodiesterase
MRGRRALRRAIATAACAVVIVATTVGGMAGALHAAGHERRTISIGTVDTQVTPALDGHVSVYVPLVDWRVRVLDPGAPVAVSIELRGIDRDHASASVGSSRAANQSLEQLRDDSRSIVDHAIRRAVVVAAVGGLLGALAGGALIGAVLLRRRWLLVAPLLGALVVAGIVVPSVRDLRSLRGDRATLTPAGGHAAELPVVLRFAAQLLDVGDEYEEHYETALASVANLAAFARRDDTGAKQGADESLFVVSDFHDNAFVLDAFDSFVGDAVVLGAGDWSQVGATVEERLAPRLAALGSRFVAISGNHDTAAYMRSLADAGAEVLDSDDPYTRVGDLLVAGYPDPLERPDGARGAHRLRVYGEEYAAQREDFLDWWDDLPERPDAVLVHQHGFAHALVEHLDDTGDAKPLLVLTGHDHEPHVHVDGRHVIVDAGTLGAGGVAAAGEQFASFVRIDLTGGRPTAAYVVEVEPLTGRARSERFSLVG